MPHTGRAAVRNDHGHVAVRVAPTQTGFFDDLGLRIMWAILLEKFVLNGGAAPIAAANIRKLAHLSVVHGVVEASGGDHPDPVWTDENGYGLNTLGKMLWHMVKALRPPVAEQGNYLQVEVLQAILHTTCAKDVDEYQEALPEVDWHQLCT